MRCCFYYAWKIMSMMMNYQLFKWIYNLKTTKKSWNSRKKYFIVEFSPLPTYLYPYATSERLSCILVVFVLFLSCLVNFGRMVSLLRSFLLVSYHPICSLRGKFFRNLGKFITEFSRRICRLVATKLYKHENDSCF